MSIVGWHASRSLRHSPIESLMGLAVAALLLPGPGIWRLAVVSTRPVWPVCVWFVNGSCHQFWGWINRMQRSGRWIHSVFERRCPPSSRRFPVKLAGYLVLVCFSWWLSMIKCVQIYSRLLKGNAASCSLMLISEPCNTSYAHGFGRSTLNHSNFYLSRCHVCVYQ